VLGSFLFRQFSIYDLLNQWETYGVFDLVLPFLLIFSIIFGILASTNILGGNKGINLIIALVIALMALRLNFVSAFFTELFPRFAIGLVVLIVLVIMTGLFIPREALKGWYIFFGVVGVIIALVAILQTFSAFDFFGSFFWQEYTTVIITSVLVIAVIIGVVMSMNADPKRKSEYITLPIEPHR